MNATAPSCTCPSDQYALIGSYCVDCSNTSIPESSGVASEDRSKCVCTTPYQWNYTLDAGGACSCNGSTLITIAQSPQCFDCNGIPYGKNTQTSGSCNCNENFNWNSTSLACECQFGWYLNVTDSTCTCPTDSAVIGSYCVNCSLITDNNGPNSGHTACTCLIPDNWIWDSSTHVGTCLCNSTYEVTTTLGGVDCLDCTTVTYATGKTLEN